MLLSLLPLIACSSGPQMDDNSLEAVDLAGDIVVDEQDVDVAGLLDVSAGADEGDWTLAIDDATWTYHSPSHVDFSSMSGDSVTVATQFNYSVSGGLVISDDTGPRFTSSSTASEDGSTAFGHAVWSRGDVIGHGVVQKRIDNEEQKVQFTDVVVTTDDGDITMLPGEPATVNIDGESWRFTVLAAYLAVNPEKSKCGAPDILSVEAVRTEEEAGPALQRPGGLFAPVGSCG